MGCYNIVCVGDVGRPHDQIKLNVLQDGALKPRGQGRAVLLPSGKFKLQCPLCSESAVITVEAAASIAEVLDANPQLLIPTVIPERFKDQHPDPWQSLRLDLLTRMLGKMHKLRVAP